MSLNTFGHLFRFTTWVKATAPPSAAWSTAARPASRCRKPTSSPGSTGASPASRKFVTQRREEDAVRILSGVFEGRTTGTPIALHIDNTDQRSKDYGSIAQSFRPGHADVTYHLKYGVRDHRGGGRSSARETASRVAAGGVARAVLAALVPGLRITGYMVQIGTRGIDRSRFDAAEVERNPFWCPDAQAAAEWETYLDDIRLAHDSVGAVIEVVAEGVPPGLGAPLYGKLDQDLAAAMMSINAVKGVEIGEGMAAAALTGSANADEMEMGKGPSLPVEPGGGHPGRHLHRPAGGVPLCGEAHLVDPDAARQREHRR